MRLFIRGAWRNFNENPPRRLDSRISIRDTRPVEGMKNGELVHSVESFKKSNDWSSDRFPEVMWTRNLPALREFYVALADAHPVAQDESKCEIRLSNGQYILLMGENVVDGKLNEQRPKVSAPCTPSHHSSTEPLQKVISVQRPSIQDFLSSCHRLKGHGVFPAQSFVDADRVSMVFEDPDSNVVHLNAVGVNISHMFGTTRSATVLQANMQIDPRILIKALQSREDAEVREMLVKSEPLAAG